jgi:hypothetical protein
MKPITPHDPLDDLLIAALHGELSPEERAQFESRLQNDPAAAAAHHEAQAMHDLLDQTHRTAQPDPDFEQRIVSAVRRKLAQPAHRETALESLMILWKGLRGIIGGHSIWTYGGVCSAVFVCVFAVLIIADNQVKSVFTTITSQLAMASSGDERRKDLQDQVDDLKAHQIKAKDSQIFTLQSRQTQNNRARAQISAMGGNLALKSGSAPTSYAFDNDLEEAEAKPPAAPTAMPPAILAAPTQTEVVTDTTSTPPPISKSSEIMNKMDDSLSTVQELATHEAKINSDHGVVASGNYTPSTDPNTGLPVLPSLAAAQTAPEDTRKLIRNAQLDLEVKSFQAAFDQITALTKSAGGYVDTSNSQRGGNGKLQGTVVVKILPPNLDAFLLKLLDLGDVQNQSVSTDDVTKDYYDTQARLVNSQKMEVQLQDLLKRENGKVSDLLAVERELGRVRGDIEQMQGQLKLYDFQVQYATVTMNLAEKDLTQAAAYLLKEQDNFSLFATDVEGTFAKARQAADAFKAQVLAADLQHNSGSDVSASLDVMVAPDQIEPFLGEIRGMGRVANFTRETQRVAKDGGDSTNPADATLTEKDKVRVQVSIRSDDDSREQVAVTVVAKAVDDALDQAKAAALAHTGVEILSSSLNKTPDGASTAQLSVRVPGPQYAALIDAFRALGRASALTIQRNDNAGPGANGDDAPVIVSLSLTDNDAPVQETDLTIAADDVDAQAQAIKKQAAEAGAEVKASSFQHQPDGTEVAQMTLRLPLGKYPAFLETLEKAGKVESLSVQRNDRPDQTEADDAAPADIMLQLHNPTAIIADNNGLWTTLRNTFGEGFAALFGSIRVIGVLLAFLAPWVFTLVLFAWIGRRIYVWRKSR